MLISLNPVTERHPETPPHSTGRAGRNRAGRCNPPNPLRRQKRTTSAVDRRRGIGLFLSSFRTCCFGHGLARRAWHHAELQLGHIMWMVDGGSKVSRVQEGWERHCPLAVPHSPRVTAHHNGWGDRVRNTPSSPFRGPSYSGSMLGSMVLYLSVVLVTRAGLRERRPRAPPTPLEGVHGATRRCPVRSPSATRRYGSAAQA